MRDLSIAKNTFTMSLLVAKQTRCNNVVFAGADDKSHSPSPLERFPLTATWLFKGGGVPLSDASEEASTFLESCSSIKP